MSESQKEKIERLAATQKPMIQRLATEREARVHYLNQAIDRGCRVHVKQSRRDAAGCPVKSARLTSEGAMEILTGDEWARCEWSTIEVDPSADDIATKIVGTTPRERPVHIPKSEILSVSSRRSNIRAAIR